MGTSSSRLFRPALLIVAIVLLLGCGATSTLVSGGGPAATPTATVTATPLPSPTATPAPGHMLVTVHPILDCSGSCTPYVCHTGMTCAEHGICTASSWPTFTLSNSGGSSVSWNAHFDGHGSSTAGWTVSAASGTLAGGAAATLTVNDDPSAIQTFPDLVFTAPGQMVTITLNCGIG